RKPSADRDRRGPDLREQRRALEHLGWVREGRGARHVLRQAEFRHGRHLGGGHSLSPRFAASPRKSRMDAGRAQRTPGRLTLMRHFYRSHLPPHEVLDRADDFFPEIGLAPTSTAARSRTFSGPLGVLKL